MLAAAVAEVRGSNLSEGLKTVLRKDRIPLDPTKIYKVATTAYVVSDDPTRLGRIESSHTGPMLRDLIVAYLQSNGFSHRS